MVRRNASRSLCFASKLYIGSLLRDACLLQCKECTVAVNTGRRPPLLVYVVNCLFVAPVGCT